LHPPLYSTALGLRERIVIEYLTCKSGRYNYIDNNSVFFLKEIKRGSFSLLEIRENKRMALNSFKVFFFLISFLGGGY
jgi:hypothetical protein